MSEEDLDFEANEFIDDHWAPLGDSNEEPKSTILEFLSSLIDSYDEYEKELIPICIGIKILISNKVIVEYLNIHLLPFKNEIIKKNDTIFLDVVYMLFSTQRFKEENYFNICKKIFKEQREIIYDYLNVIFVCVEKYNNGQKIVHRRYSEISDEDE